jgi:Mg-chelatase subunit ChlD
MKKIMMSLLLGVMLIGQLSVAHGLGVEENPFLQTSNEKIVKVNLDETTLIVFLIDTSRTMRGNGIQTTIDESRTIIEPTKDRGVIQEKLTTLTCQGKSDLTAGLKTVGKLVESKQFTKTNLIIISDNAPTSGETLQKGTYKRKDIYSYKFANAADDFAKVLKSARVSIRTLAFMDHVANTTKDFT